MPDPGHPAAGASAAAPIVRPTDIRVDERGIFAKAPQDVVLDVAFDGRRIFSFWLMRDGEPDSGGYLVEWPKTLRSFLNGTVQVSLSAPGIDDPVFDQELALGEAGAGRIAIVDEEGRPLSLDKGWRRVRTFDTGSPEQVAPLMDAIDEVLTVLQGAGLEPFLAYGTLLGAARGGKLIGHDSDADLGYVSRHEHPVDVMRESFAAQRYVHSRGYSTFRYSGAGFRVDVPEPDGTERGLDVFGGFMRDGYLFLMGEIRVPFDRAWVTPLTEVELEGRVFPAPADVDKVLTATYGENWRIPDPAFHFETPPSTYRRLNGWFRGIRVGRAKWDRVYSHNRPPAASGSALLEEILAEQPEIAHLVDLGCGRGGDVLAAARAGVPTTGLDVVSGAYAQAVEQANAEGLPAEFRELNLMETRSVLGTGAWLARTPGPRVLMARHLVDTLTEEGRAGLWRLADMATRDGGELHLEFLVHSGKSGFAREHHVTPRQITRIEREIVASGGRLVRTDRRRIAGDSSAQHDSDSKTATTCRMVATWER